MILSRSVSDYIFNQLTLARLVGVESLIIEEGCIRGTGKELMVMMLHTDNVPQFDFGSIGIKNVKNLIDRWDIIKDMDDNHQVEVIMADSDDKYVRSLNIKMNNKAQVGFRATSPQLIRAPKKMKDTVSVPEMNLNNASVLTDITKGARAMNSDRVKLIISEGQLHALIKDIDGEELRMNLQVDDIVDDDGELITGVEHVHRIEALSILSLLGKRVKKVSCTTRGMLVLDVDNMSTIYLTPFAEGMK